MTINETLNKEYPKLLLKVFSDTSQEDKLKSVHEFIELLNILAEELENGKTKR